MILSDQVRWSPTYNYAVVVDDHLMGITHVILRGSSVQYAKADQVYGLLVFLAPICPYPDDFRSRFDSSFQRHGATSVTQFRDEGYLSAAMLNYLALLGWGLR